MAFAPDTALPGSKAFPPSAGHCAVVAYIVRKRLGGDLVSAIVDGQSHWFNRINEIDCDITADQFGMSAVRVAPAGDLYPGTLVRSGFDLDRGTLNRAHLLADRSWRKT